MLAIRNPRGHRAVAGAEGAAGAGAPRVQRAASIPMRSRSPRKLGRGRPRRAGLDRLRAGASRTVPAPDPSRRPRGARHAGKALRTRRSSALGTGWSSRSRSASRYTSTSEHSLDGAKSARRPSSSSLRSGKPELVDAPRVATCCSTGGRGRSNSAAKRFRTGSDRGGALYPGADPCRGGAQTERRCSRRSHVLACRRGARRERPAAGSRGGAMSGWMPRGCSARGARYYARIWTGVVQVIRPERALQMAAGDDPKPTLASLEAQWKELKDRWK